MITILTTEDILQYTLRAESMATAKIGCYSGTECQCIMPLFTTDCAFPKGLLQILFLAGATKFAVKQHIELPQDEYDTTVFPCGCTEDVKGIVHIMWVKADPYSSTSNHIIPLLTKSKHIFF